MSVCFSSCRLLSMLCLNLHRCPPTRTQVIYDSRILPLCHPGINKSSCLNWQRSILPSQSFPGYFPSGRQHIRCYQVTSRIGRGVYRFLPCIHTTVPWRHASFFFFLLVKCFSQIDPTRLDGMMKYSIFHHQMFVSFTASMLIPLFLINSFD